jgi:hypothetical protein
MTNISSLLARWAQLEPERCRFTAQPQVDESWYSIQLGSDRINVEYRHAASEDLALIQAAVQDAVESKHWLWRVQRLVETGYRAGIETTTSYITEQGSSPTHALLNSYLVAIEYSESEPQSDANDP